MTFKVLRENILKGRKKMKHSSEDFTKGLQGFLSQRDDDIFSKLSENDAYKSLDGKISSLTYKVLERLTGDSLYLAKQLIAQIDLRTGIQNKYNYFTGLMDFGSLRNYFGEAFIDDELAKCSAHGIPMYYESSGGTA